jgi:hypothetical protein
MPPRQNPLKLNGLQLRTLAVLQAIARVDGAAKPGPQDGEMTITRFPSPHGDHFHVGEATVATRDASGLFNEAVWNALTRKGLARADWPHMITLTAAALDYETGVADEVLRVAPH